MKYQPIFAHKEFLLFSEKFLIMTEMFSLAQNVYMAEWYNYIRGLGVFTG